MATIRWLRLAVVACVAAALVGGAVATHNGDEYNHEDRGWFQSVGDSLSTLWPFGNKLGHDWAETQEKVENIYRDTHHQAQRKVDELKEHALQSHSEIQEQIANIYRNAALEAERRIDHLKTPILAQIRRRLHLDKEKEHVDEPSIGEKIVGKAKDAAHAVGQKGVDVQTAFEDATKKVSDAYKGALDKAKTAVGDIKPETAIGEVKRRVSAAYDEAFHKQHGETRTVLGRMRDGIGRGMHRAADMGKSAAVTTWHLALHSMMAIFWLTLGGITSSGLWLWWNRRQFKKQLKSNFAGPISVVQEFLVVGDEEKQRKFVEYWTNVGLNYMQRQPGLKKATLHRGIGDQSNKWLNCAEWNSVEDLRKAMTSSEFRDIKRRAPFTLRCQTIFQVAQTHVAGGRTAGEAGESSGAEGLRHRVAASGPGSAPTASR